MLFESLRPRSLRPPRSQDRYRYGSYYPPLLSKLLQTDSKVIAEAVPLRIAAETESLIFPRYAKYASWWQDFQITQYRCFRTVGCSCRQLFFRKVRSAWSSSSRTFWDPGHSGNHDFKFMRERERERGRNTAGTLQNCRTRNTIGDHLVHGLPF